MILSALPLSDMGAPQPARIPLSHHLSQWSRTPIFTISDATEDDDGEVKKSPPEQSGSGFIIGSTDAVARVAHLEHSVRFLQEQHRLMLSGLHTEIEALRERNRDLQFQLIFNKESSPKPTSSPQEESGESPEEANLKSEVTRLEREAAAARSEARAAEARALQLQRLVDTQTEKLRELESQQCSHQADASAAAAAAEAREAALSPGAAETRAELRARLAEAERLVRRLRADAERQRRELQCMKNSLHASLRASGLDAPYGFQNNYHFPPVHTPDFWREPLREDFNMVGSRGRSTRRPLTLPELTGQQIHRSTVYANNHTRSRANGYEPKNKKGQVVNEASENKSPEEQPVSESHCLNCTNEFAKPILDSYATYPELKVVVTKLLPQEKVTQGTTSTENGRRPRRHHHRKHATDHT